MLPTSQWRIQRMLRKSYEEKIAYLEENLARMRQMAGEFLDEGDMEAVASIQLLMEEDQRHINELKKNLEIVSDDSCFQKVYREQTEEGDEDDRPGG